MSWDAVIFDFEDTLVDLSRGKPPRGRPAYYAGAPGVPPVLDATGRPIMDALLELAQRGIPVAVVTASPEAALGRWCKEHRFSLPGCVIGFHDTVLHRPSPHPLIQALNVLGVTPSARVLSVGDSPDDIEASRRAGLTSATMRPWVPLSSPPDLFLPTIEGLFDDDAVYCLLGDYERTAWGVCLNTVNEGSESWVAGRMQDGSRRRLDQMIQRGQQGRWHPLLVDLTRMLVETALEQDPPRGTVLTGVPNHVGGSEHMRGLLARLKTATGLPATRLLRFRSDPGRQSGRDRDARRAAMDGTMEARGGADLTGRTVVVVDDVRVTGATLAEAARALEEAGADRVITVALAQEEFRDLDGEWAEYGPLREEDAEGPRVTTATRRRAPVRTAAPTETSAGRARVEAASEQDDLAEGDELDRIEAGLQASLAELESAADDLEAAAVELEEDDEEEGDEPGLFDALSPEAGAEADEEEAADPEDDDLEDEDLDEFEEEELLDEDEEAGEDEDLDEDEDLVEGEALEDDDELDEDEDEWEEGEELEEEADLEEDEAEATALDGEDDAPLEDEGEDEDEDEVAAPVEAAAGPEEVVDDIPSIRRRYPRAYQRWTPEEDVRLRELFAAEQSIPEIADDLGRQPNACEARVRKLGLDELPEDDEEQAPEAAASDAARPAPRPTVSEGELEAGA